ncbi:hypothetical protein [Streptomyces sp. NPDC058572]|uniref:hypothetical protein n=1 Tax=Streptomyces sp. NPDC058572 TaxID=3346546 RepID=UPI0036492586
MAKRRPNGGGTITKRKDGRYQGAAYVTNTDGHRVRKFVYGSTYDEAAEKLGRLQDQERNGVPVPSRSWTVGEWLAYWLEHIVKPSCEYKELVDMPKVSKGEGKPWSAREAIEFLRASRAHRLYAACVLVLVLGLRRSEVLGLRWQDIDFDRQQFTPVKQVQATTAAWC